MPEDKTGRRLLFTIQQMHVCLHCLQHTARGLDSFRLSVQNQYKPQVKRVFYRTRMTISLNMVLVSGRQQGSPVRSQFERCKGAEWDRVQIENIYIYRPTCQDKERNRLPRRSLTSTSRPNRDPRDEGCINYENQKKKEKNKEKTTTTKTHQQIRCYRPLRRSVTRPTPR